MGGTVPSRRAAEAGVGCELLLLVVLVEVPLGRLRGPVFFFLGFWDWDWDCEGCWVRVGEETRFGGVMEDLSPVAAGGVGIAVLDWPFIWDRDSVMYVLERKMWLYKRDDVAHLPFLGWVVSCEGLSDLTCVVCRSADDQLVVDRTCRPDWVEGPSVPLVEQSSAVLRHCPSAPCAAIVRASVQSSLVHLHPVDIDPQRRSSRCTRADDCLDEAMVLVSGP